MICWKLKMRNPELGELGFSWSKSKLKTAQSPHEMVISGSGVCEKI